MEGNPPENSSTKGRWIGLIGGPVLAIVAYAAIPEASRGETGEIIAGLEQPGRAVAAVGILMAWLWVTEAIPISATALLPIALFPFLTGGNVSIGRATAPYADDLIFLFMGGFLLALAMQQWGLHRRLALHTILLVGTRPTALVAGFMLASAMLSMWVSNTATVVMMLPIAMSVVELVKRETASLEARSSNFGLCLMLGTAYAASIGGIGTLIGTPPNLILAAYLKEDFGLEISFVRWMAVGLPLVAVFLPIAWVVLVKVVFPIEAGRFAGGRALIRRELDEQGATSRAEWAVLIIFLLTAVAWVTRPLLVDLSWSNGRFPLAGLSDAGIAIAAGVVLFAVPIYPKKAAFLLTWRQAMKLPWGILVLFGGGLSLASAVKATGVAEFIGRGVAGAHALPVPLLMLLVTAAIVFLTELTSNTATTATFLPILGAVAVGLGINPTLLVIPLALGASCAFMMPVATPPNAIIFGSGEVTIPQMCKAGLWLNLIGIGLIMGLMYGIVIHTLPGSVP